MKQILKLKRNLCLLLLPISFLCLYIAKHNPKIAEEVFAKRIFHVWSVVLSRIFGMVPFSVAELICILGPIVVTVIFIRFVLHIVTCKKIVVPVNTEEESQEEESQEAEQDKTEQNEAELEKTKLQKADKKEIRSIRGYIIAKGIINLLCAISIIYFLYVFGCGINYYRYSFSYYSELTVQESTEEELYQLCETLAKQANELREDTTDRDEDGVFTNSMTTLELISESRKAYVELSKEYPILSGWYPGPKPIMLSKLMSHTQITGIFIPFTMEANVNVDIPDYSVASTMCHELAHLRGFMREDEANYISYLACMASGNAELKYSGTMQALIVSGNALYTKNVELYRKIAALYSDGVKKDMIANSEYWNRFKDTVVSNAAEKVNNTYLKANDQHDGTQSYGRMVDLLLAKQRKDNLSYFD